MDNLNVYTIEAKRFRSFFTSIQAINAVASLATFWLISNSFILFPEFVVERTVTSTILLILVAGSIFFSIYQNRRLAAITKMEDFELQVNEYEKFCKRRLFWYLASCLTSCFLALLTQRMIFFYFALFDIVVAFSVYPSRGRIRKELKNDEIILV